MIPAEPLTLHKCVDVPDNILHSNGDFPKADFGYYGDMDPIGMSARADAFLSENGIINVKVSEGLKQLIGLCDQPACWMVIRLRHPTTDYKIPRWHRDGIMFTWNVPTRKIAVCLYGAPTLLLHETKLVTETVRYEVGVNSDVFRNEWAEILKNELEIKLKPGQMFSFTCGEVNSPVHSEPDILTNRIFASIVPGSVNAVEYRVMKQNEYRRQFAEEQRLLGIEVKIKDEVYIDK